MELKRKEMLVWVANMCTHGRRWGTREPRLKWRRIWRHFGFDLVFPDGRSADLSSRRHSRAMPFGGASALFDPWAVGIAALHYTLPFHLVRQKKSTDMFTHHICGDKDVFAEAFCSFRFSTSCNHVCIPQHVLITLSNPSLMFTTCTHKQDIPHTLVSWNA